MSRASAAALPIATIPQGPSCLPMPILLMSGSGLQVHSRGISRGITDRDIPAGPGLLANVNPTFEWIRLAQRIPVRIHIDDVPKGVLISSGMTCTVVVESSPRQWAVLAALHGW